ncbi:MAG: helix-turn-helix domain-containing protein [Treponema sp.]|nr:helix-turn-helix domain-containing protein [Treponema sp.]
MAKGGRRVRIFSALEVANICGVVNQTAINWIRNGHLKAFTTPGGQYRIYAKDLAAFLDKRGMSASEEILQVMMENANWNTFLIGAEQSVNDALKEKIAKLLPEYTIIQAFDWFDVGRKFTEEKPGFSLLDTDLEGADIARVITTVKDEPIFGKPYIFLLTDSSSFVQENHGKGANSAETSRADVLFTRPLDMGKFETAVRTLERQLDTANIA